MLPETEQELAKLYNSVGALDKNEIITRRSGLFYKVFVLSPDGKEVLEILKDMFANRTTFDSNPYISAKKDGWREVVLFIEDLVNYATKEND